jgi:hypothetical protein
MPTAPIQFGWMDNRPGTLASGIFLGGHPFKYSVTSIKRAVLLNYFKCFDLGTLGSKAKHLK